MYNAISTRAGVKNRAKHSKQHFLHEPGFDDYGPYGDEVSTIHVATVVMMTKVSKRIL